MKQTPEQTAAAQARADRAEASKPRKQIMIEARYGNSDGQAVRRAKSALKAGWHGTERDSFLSGPKGRLP